MIDIDLDSLAVLAEAATPGPWKVGEEKTEHWVNADGECPVCRYNDPLAVQTRHVGFMNSESRTAHIHRVPEGIWRDRHGIYADRGDDGEVPVLAVNNDEYDVLDLADADRNYLAALDPGTVLAMIDRLRRAEHLVHLWRETAWEYEQEMLSARQSGNLDGQHELSLKVRQFRNRAEELWAALVPPVETEGDKGNG